MGKRFNRIDSRLHVFLYCGKYVSASGKNLIAANNQRFNYLIPQPTFQQLLLSKTQVTQQDQKT
jgi:hypothetical protein